MNIDLLRNCNAENLLRKNIKAVFWEMNAVNLPLNCFYTQFVLCQFHYCIAGNTNEDIVMTGWRN